MEDQELEKLGYTFVFDIGEYDYSWTEMRVYTKGDRVYSNTQSGCSCNSWEEPFESQLVELPTLESAIRQYSELREEYYIESRELNSHMKVLDFIDKMRELGLR